MKTVENTAEMRQAIKKYERACDKRIAIEQECKLLKQDLMRRMGRVRAVLVGRTTVLVKDTIRVPAHTKQVPAYSYKNLHITTLTNFARMQEQRKSARARQKK